MNEYEELRKHRWVGFAEVYLWRCNEESKTKNIPDIQVYRKLVKLDTRLGTTSSEQLFECLLHTTRSDIIKVDIIPSNKDSSFFKTIDFEQVNEYDRLRKENWVGFAEVYLNRCSKELTTENIPDIQVYNQLVKLDTRLGTTSSEQLFKCLFRTTRLDIIKVKLKSANKN